ncbi:RNA polymerase sigma factor [Marinagarivorans algicola]|uniref:RNA polymerase sigma factor n=1 Tax=Marinagarivorans algicola TaxID=1513270 RepID=UPI0009E9AA7A|nr:RNA polymerase sigma factor [Marinagarivorans algicola]
MPLTERLDLEELFNEHRNRLTCYIRRKTPNMQDAEDIAQSAFMQVQLAAKQYDIVNPTSYLYQTASNIFIDMKRRQKLHESYMYSAIGATANENNTTDSAYSAPGPDRVVSAQHELTRIQSVISRMPEKQRRAFLLHRIKGMTYNDIAATMSVSTSSVEKYIFNALKQCRKELLEDNEAL